MTRKYSSISTSTTLASSISNSATSMTVATGTAVTLLGGVTLTVGNVDTFAVAIDPDTVNEEIVFITAVSGDSFTIVRARSGSSAVSHSSGATVKHVLVSADLDSFESTNNNAVTLTGTQTLTNKNLSSTTNTFPTSLVTLTGTQSLTNKDLSSGTNSFPTSLTTLTGTQTLTNKTLTAPVLTNPINVSPEERLTVSATAATGTVNFDLSTQGMLYYTTNASANFTLNFRGNSTTTLNSILATGDSISAVFLNTNGSTAYYPTAFQVDGSSVTPKWAGGTAPAAGNASSIDAYTFTIIKTASATFTVLAGGPVKFA